MKIFFNLKGGFFFLFLPLFIQFYQLDNRIFIEPYRIKISSCNSYPLSCTRVVFIKQHNFSDKLLYVLSSIGMLIGNGSIYFCCYLLCILRFLTRSLIKILFNLITLYFMFLTSHNIVVPNFALLFLGLFPSCFSNWLWLNPCIEFLRELLIKEPNIGKIQVHTAYNMFFELRSDQTVKPFDFCLSTLHIFH